MQRITDKLHLHRKNRAPAPASALAQDTLVKPGVTLNAQGQPITQPIAPLPGSIPLASQPSTLGKHPHGDVPATGLTQAPILQQPTLQQPILQQSTLQQTQRTLVQPPLQQPIMQQSTLQQTALPQQQWQQSNLQQGFPLQKQGFQQQGWQQGMQQQGMQQGWQQGMQQNVQTITRPAVVESIVRPAMVEQTARIEKVVEVQPVIHRNIDAPEVHIIEQHSYETAALAGPHMITNPTIVEEVVKPRVIEEVVPVIHREVPAPVIERVEQHIQERVSQPAVTNKVIQQQGSVIVQGQARALPTQQIASQPTVMHSTAATLTETVTVPTVVEQTVVPQKITEVQPVIHRTIDAPEVHMIEKHMYEQVRSTGPSVLYRQPLVEETVTPRIIEDIQPVIHREVPQVVVERQEQHITENLTQAAVTTKQVIEDRVTKPLPPIPSQTRAMAQPTAAPTVHSVTAAATVENRTMPAIIEQTARREVIQEIQPIIHREIDAPEVRVIEQHSYETVASTGPSTVTLAPVVQETVHPKIIEEIHPVLHRTVPQPFVERVEQHTTETISQPVVTTKQVFNTPMQTTTMPLQQQQTFAAAPLAGGLQQASGIPVPPPLPSKGFHSSQRGLQQQQGWSNNWNNNQQQGWNNLNNQQQQGWNNNQQQQGWNNNLSQQPGWNDNLNNQPQGWNNRQQQGWNNNQQQGWNNNQQQGWNNQQQPQQGWNNNLGGQQFASNIPTPPPLPSKQLTTGAFNNNLLGSKLQQNNLNNTFASPMMRGNQNQMPLQSNNLQGNLQRNIQNTLQNTLQGNQSNIPVPPPLPSSTTAQFAEKAPLERNAMGSFQQAGRHAHFI